MALLVNPINPASDIQVRELQESARNLAVRLEAFNISAEREIEATVAAAAQRSAAALFIMSDGFLVSRTEKISTLALRYKMQTFTTPEQIDAGALLGYGPDLLDSYRQSGVYVARILKGEKVVDLPVFQATKLMLAINLKIAKALDLAVPPDLLSIADEVIK